MGTFLKLKDMNKKIILPCDDLASIHQVTVIHTCGHYWTHLASSRELSSLFDYFRIQEEFECPGCHGDTVTVEEVELNKNWKKENVT
jgi:hypothetical protein